MCTGNTGQQDEVGSPCSEDTRAAHSTAPIPHRHTSAVPPAEPSMNGLASPQVGYITTILIIPALYPDKDSKR